MKILLGVTGCIGAYKAAEVLRGLLRNVGELGQVEEVGLDQCHRIGARGVELRLEQARFAGRGAIVQHQVRPRGVQPAADGRADTLCASGDQYDFALHARSPKLGGKDQDRSKLYMPTVP